MNGTLKKRLKNHEDTRRMTEKKLEDFVHVMPCEIPIITLGVKVETSLELPRALENG